MNFLKGVLRLFKEQNNFLDEDSDEEVDYHTSKWHYNRLNLEYNVFIKSLNKSELSMLAHTVKSSQ